MITKQGIDISFAQGLDTKTDPKRVSIGNFVSLENTVFTNAGLLQKRNGFAELVALPSNTFSYITTFNNSLTALGTSIAAYSPTTTSWVAKGNIQPLSLNTSALIRNNYPQEFCDIATNAGIYCLVYAENRNSTSVYLYAVVDSVTQQVLLPPTIIPFSTVENLEVFALGADFAILVENSNTISYLIIQATPPYTTITTGTLATGVETWNAYAANNRVYVAYSGSLATTIQTAYLNTSFSVVAGSTITIPAPTVGLSITFDISSSDVFVTWSDASPSLYGAVWTANLVNTVGATRLGSLGGNPEGPITCVSQNGTCQIFVEIIDGYIWNTGGGPGTNFIQTGTINSSGATSSITVSVNSVGLASRAFIVNSVIYYLSIYRSVSQSTYFIINGASSQTSPIVTAKLAYENAPGTNNTYFALLQQVIVNGSIAVFPYLYQDQIQSINKTIGAAVTAGVYSQLGINLATIDIGTQDTDTAEIGSDLHFSGGFLWMYDGLFPVEHNFFLWPDTDQSDPANTATWSSTGGSMAAQPGGASAGNTNVYYYQFTYEWTDNQGNAFRSAPSIPIPVTTTGSGTTGSVSIYIPNLRLTYKINTPVKLVVYRWSAGQQNYYQTTSITNPLINNTSVNSTHYTDTLADSSIIGNNLIYTTGGVVEDVNAPATNIMTLFDTRLWLVDAEDQNLLWYSKQVIEDTPVEMSDLFTFYIAPTTGAGGSTGPITALFPMDDKLIIFKNNAIYYINGTGPDNTGANNNYSQPIFITATVGCADQQSIAFMPQGLMFQSDKGIWLLGRDLSTNYIGAPVEEFNNIPIISAQNIPATNQVRFVLNTGTMLIYDYFYQQWGTFVFGIGTPTVSATLYQGMQTFITNSGTIYQEQTGLYSDGATSPVLMQFTTGPLRLGDLQNYQRAYFFYLLGSYQSPHSLQIATTFDYDTTITNSTTITPVNTVVGSLENWRIFLQQQRCQAFAIDVQEVFTGTYGAGLTLSGINVVAGFKKQFRPIPSAQTVGAS